MTLIRALQDSRALIILRESLGIRSRTLCRFYWKRISCYRGSYELPPCSGTDRRLATAFKGHAIIGAGTVLSIEEAQRALEAGASFLVSPHVEETLLTFCREAGIPAIPGAFTPTEIWRAWQGGAAMVKIFPAMPSGPEYIRHLRGPFPTLPLLPTGGITIENATAFLRAGAIAVGIGSALVNPNLITREGLNKFRARCRTLFSSLHEL
jgi:2-dehydro-3-deoxyphosphogluconate aldolase / (4S)-4-hydroxy-2-oxoglutarate aldolase